MIGDYSTQAWDNYLIERGHDPRIASVNVDAELARLGITREDPKKWLHESVRITQEALGDRNVMSIYEATVHIDSYTTRADILHRDTTRLPWKIIELKSITSYDSFTSRPSGYSDPRYKYIDDMAYTNMVFGRAGVPVQGVYLLNVNKGCNSVNLRITSDQHSRSTRRNSFFDMSTEFDQSITNQTLNFNDLWDYVRDVTSDPEPPQVEFELSCKKCPMCVRYLDVENNNYIFNIPFASAAGSLKTKLNSLIRKNRYRLENIPPYFFSELRNGRDNLREQTAAVVTECTKQDKSYVRATASDGGLPRLLSTMPGDAHGLKWPVIYLDFEFLGTAVPLWDEIRGEGHDPLAVPDIIQPGVRPYEPVPVQYSLHASKSDPSSTFPIPLHLPASPCFEKSFIAIPGQDMRLKMALQLATDLREAASSMEVRLEDVSIIVWHQTAELGCLNYFTGGTDKYPNSFPWLPAWAVETLQIAKTNIVDLLNIVRGGKVRPAVPGFKTKLNYYHPIFRGSFSLKNVIKMLSGSNPYVNGAIGSGAEAFAKYGELSYAFSGKAPNYWNINNYTDGEVTDILASLDTYCKEDTYSLYRVHKELVLQARNFLTGDSNIIGYKDIPFSGDVSVNFRRINKKLPDIFE